MSSAKVCFLPRDCGGQSRLKAGAKTSTRPSEVSGDRVGQQLNRGRQKGVQKCTPVGGSFRRNRKKWNFTCRKECSSWKMYILPSEPHGLATKGSHNLSSTPLVNSPSPWGLLDLDIYFVGSLEACL